jgi:hypothetical protein
VPGRLFRRSARCDSDSKRLQAGFWGARRLDEVANRPLLASAAIARAPPAPRLHPNLTIREVLQSVEDALIDNGWDEINVRTDHGLFTWRTDKRAAEIEEEENRDDEDYLGG